MPTTSVIAACSFRALTGVLYVGCSRVSHAGSAPVRAIENHIRVDAFMHAIETAMHEFSSASGTAHQSAPQYCLASTKAGSSSELTSVLIRSVPQPSVSPHAQNVNSRPISSTAPISARGMLRRGSAVSSASGAADSQPESAKTENTTANQSPCEDVFHGSKPSRFRPPGPGSNTHQTESRKTTAISARPRISIALAEIVTPRYISVSTTPVIARKITHHGMFQPSFEPLISCWSSTQRKIGEVNVAA